MNDISAKAKAIRTLYKLGRITIDGVKEAVTTSIITEDEYIIITGYIFPNPIA